MSLTALVMASGGGSRLALGVEKPFLQVSGKAIVEHVLDALKASRKVDCIIVAVSKHTPRTAERMGELSVKVVETDGEGYVPDLRHAVERLKLEKVLTVSADLPLVTGVIIDRIVSYYEACRKTLAGESSSSPLTFFLNDLTPSKLLATLYKAFWARGDEA